MVEKRTGTTKMIVLSGARHLLPLEKVEELAEETKSLSDGLWS